MPYHKKRKTDRPPRELIAEDSMKAAGAAVLDGKPVNAGYSAALRLGALLSSPT